MDFDVKLSFIHISKAAWVTHFLRGNENANEGTRFDNAVEKSHKIPQEAKMFKSKPAVALENAL